MPGSRALALFAILVGSVLGGCAVPVRGGFSDVEQATADRLGSDATWRQSSEDDVVARERVDALLEMQISPESAVQIALLQNPDLQAIYETLGVAQADFVQAGLLQNPVLVVAPRFGVGSVSGTNLEMDIAQNLLQLLTLRSRKELADTQFHEARLHVTHQVLGIVAEVREAYYELVAARHLVSVLQTAEEAADASSEYATRLHAAGNLSDLGLARELALFEEARVARELSEAALIAPRENLRRLLGVEGGATLDTPLILPALPEARVSSEGLEALALTKRLDLQALGKEIEAFEQALSLARFYQWVPFVEVGISAAREVDGGWVVGPQFALEIPIFDQGQAQVARIEAMLRERMRAHEALTLDIRRDVRIQSEAVRAARALADRYRATLIPLRERIVRLTNQEYNFMLVGAFELLSAKRDEIATYREYVGALRSYWSSRARLQSALGGLPAPVAALERPIETSSESTEMDHMTHDGNHSPPESEEKRSPGHEHHHEGHQQ